MYWRRHAAETPGTPGDQNQIFVVLTDMMMPVMDGTAMIHSLKRINPEVKIIAASGLGAYDGMVSVSGAGITHS